MASSNNSSGGLLPQGVYTLPSWTDTTTYQQYQLPIKAPKEQETDTLLAMLRSRLRTPTSQPLPFDHIYATKVDGTGNVLVLVVNNKQHVLLEDGYELFPSDTLITQLRLLAK